MRAHLIKDGTVINTIEVESLDFMPGLVDASLGGQRGEMWDGNKFHPFPSSTAKPTPDEISEAAKTELSKINLSSIESMREFIVAKFGNDPLIPGSLIGHEAKAKEERKKIE